MITKFKIFEKMTFKCKKYWLIPTDDRFDDSLEKIGCKDDEYIPREYVRNIHYIFILEEIGYLYDKNNKKWFVDYNYWSWNPYIGNLKDDYSEKNGYEFQGIVNIEPYELDALKYNL